MYTPHTEAEIQKMLEVIGADSIDSLFRSIPQGIRLRAPLKLPPSHSEHALKKEMARLAGKNTSLNQIDAFLGGGIYHHFIPSAVSQIITRGEFLTAYTPYQPEVSQGTLQAIFEYQTMIAQIFNMEVCNASNYDASTATAEAALMGLRLKEGDHLYVARSIHPQYRETLKTYLKSFKVKIEEIPYGQNGQCDPAWLKKHVNERTSSVILGYPNYFGVVEPLHELVPIIQSAGAIAITVTMEPLSLALLTPPGDFGVDIAVGEGQSFGIPPSCGGPTLGLFTVKKKYVRSMPGRLVGETVDAEGKRGYVVTLSTREQHIRREKATSNICTNVSLCALASSLYLSLMGKNGLTELAQRNYDKAAYARAKLKNKVKFSGPTFNEFVVQCHCEEVEDQRSNPVLPGLSLKEYPELKDCRLITVTELNSKAAIDHLCEVL